MSVYLILFIYLQTMISYFQFILFIIYLLINLLIIFISIYNIHFELLIYATSIISSFYNLFTFRSLSYLSTKLISLFSFIFITYHLITFISYLLIHIINILAYFISLNYHSM
jgi:hypothetical protein